MAKTKRVPDPELLSDGGVPVDGEVGVPTKEAEDEEQWKSLYQFKERRWRSILLNEDRIVAALGKSLMRFGETVTFAAAYQAVRDVIGEIAELGGPALENRLDAVVAAAPPGSDDKVPLVPAPNP